VVVAVLGGRERAAESRQLRGAWFRETRGGPASPDGNRDHHAVLRRYPADMGTSGRSRHGQPGEVEGA
jgi:hypothetical protein